MNTTEMFVQTIGAPVAVRFDGTQANAVNMRIDAECTVFGERTVASQL